ncbi:MAG TPA: group I intron-associated PD-(D/E)XK endonuclease [Terriglobales bacterium]|nr:group I intron-associated PD-(D/E)XK endonuclease [Terriglobales bacterium]
MKTLKRQQPRSCPRLRHPKLKGEWAEIAFMSKAMSLGFTVCRPYGDSHIFDFLVFTADCKVSRVQVKSCWTKSKGYYPLNTHSAYRRRYRPRDIDFVVGYVVPHDAWYVIPVRKITGTMSALFPHKPLSRGRYERYRDAWHLLRSQPSQIAEVRLQK